MHAEYSGNENQNIKLWFAIKDEQHPCVINQNDHEAISFPYNDSKKTLNIQFMNDSFEE